MNYYPVVVVGGGASGLFFTHLVKEALLLEKMNQCGIKLLVTGNGASNITHSENIENFVTHYYDKRNFVSPSLYSLSPTSLRKVFSSLGVETYTRSDGKVFPVSMKSLDIRDSLLSLVKNVKYNSEVLSIERKDDEYVVKTKEECYRAKIVVVATGGKSLEKSGSNGSGYDLLSSLGHTIIKPRASLVEIKVKDNIAELEGISLDDVTLKIGKASFSGPVVFTRAGLSGPASLNISHYKDLSDSLVISLFPFTQDMLKKENGKLTIINGLRNITSLPHRLLSFLFPFGKKQIASATKDEIKIIVEKLNRWELKIKNIDDYAKAMVTKGGVDTKEINNKTMESKINKNLYVLGELLDVDGECGGYNLNFAFASAYVAAQDIKKKILNLLHFHNLIL